MELHMTTIAAFQAKPDRRSLASLKRDLAWLRTRINAGTDPTVQKYIAEKPGLPPPPSVEDGHEPRHVRQHDRDAVVVAHRLMRHATEAVL
jgi:hypothetical protein